MRRVERQGLALKTHPSIIGAAGALVLLATAWSRAASPATDAAFQRFWDAANPGEAAKAADEVVKSGAAFDDAAARLQAGRAYSAKVPRGIVRLSRKVAADEFFYDLNVPDNYDAARRYQVRFQLHGGIMGRDTSQPRGDGAVNLAGAEQIYVIPYAWRDAPWWSDAQLENLRGILDSIKRTYNVDENRVVLAGVSDGGTGAFYFAMRDTTPFASFLPLNAFLMVLSHPQTGAAVLAPNNLRNKPLFVVNGGIDQLYPTGLVEPYLEHLEAGGVSIEYHPQPTAGHNTRWWPEVKDLFETFVRKSPREPFPAKLTWESDGAARANRAHWLVIDRVTSTDTPGGPPDLNQVVRPGAATGPAVSGVPAYTLFQHERPFGRVDLVRTGNRVEATTRNVEELTLLLSPNVFDFSQPVRVVANGRVVFDGRVAKSVATLMKWAARDNDRTMLFGAEVHIKMGS